jgi:hypothetical protein
MFEALAGDCGGRDGGRDGSEGAGIGAEVDQREEKQVKKKYSIGQPARSLADHRQARSAGRWFGTA